MALLEIDVKNESELKEKFEELKTIFPKILEYYIIDKVKIGDGFNLTMYKK